jgi:hypothetical protein
VILAASTVAIVAIAAVVIVVVGDLSRKPRAERG